MLEIASSTDNRAPGPSPSCCRLLRRRTRACGESASAGCPLDCCSPSCLSKDEVVRTEELAKWPRANGVHGSSGQHGQRSSKAEQELLANGKAVGTAIAQLRQSLSTQIPEAWLKIHQDRAGNVASSSRLVEVHLSCPTKRAADHVLDVHTCTCTNAPRTLGPCSAGTLIRSSCRSESPWYVPSEECSIRNFKKLKQNDLNCRSVFLVYKARFSESETGMNLRGK